MYEQFAEAAIHHARERHAIDFEKLSLILVDRILDSERSSLDVSELESLVLCYGAWFGEHLVQRFEGCWVGLHEPTPPRIRINGVRYSPMDAVRRRLTDSQTPTLAKLTECVVQRSVNDKDKKQYAENNRSAWDLLVDDARFVAPGELSLECEVLRDSLDPWIKNEPHLSGKNVLCLGAGGGMHSPMLASLGTHVTVVDISEQQIEFDQRLADRYELAVSTVQTSLDDLSQFENSSFDIVLQPVSMSYVPDCRKAYQEIARVLRPGGLYVVQHKHPLSLQANPRSNDTGLMIERSLKDGPTLQPTDTFSPYREPKTYEFLHSLETLIGELCRCGFVIEDFQEPVRDDAWATPGSQEHRANYIPPYFKIKARRQ
jgi:2-polyprenyl-3-methyl-5-hydroxy-6-metoxy-1,4-benzoquinol methylase